MTLALRNSGVGCSSVTRVTSACISWSCAFRVWLGHLSNLVPFKLPCQSASLWDRTARMTMSSAAPAVCKSARRSSCTNWIWALCPVNLCPIVILQPEFKIVILLTICISANTLSQTRNKLNKSYIDSLLISTSHRNLPVGCACLTRKGYEPQQLVKDCSSGNHNFCKREFPPLFVALSANLAGNRCTLALIAGKLSTTASFWTYSLTCECRTSTASLFCWRLFQGHQLISICNHQTIWCW